MKKIITLFSLLIAVATFAQQPIAPTFTTQPTTATDSIAQTAISAQTLEATPPLSSLSQNGSRWAAQQNNSPYEWKWVRDGIWTGAGLAGAAIGLRIIQEKDDLSQAEFDKINNNIDEAIADINSIDRWAAGNHSESASQLSDIPFAFSFAAPFALLFDDKINDHTGQYIGMYIQTLATTATMYTLTAGLVDRSRPYVYDVSGETSDERRMKNNGQRSFYAGHVAASATATFFAAKVYSDFNPDSPGRAWMWAGAAAIPAGVAYLRVEAGQHFLTDVALGYVLGAATGILVPELHKRKSDHVRIYPTTGTAFNGDNYKSMVFAYNF